MTARKQRRFHGVIAPLVTPFGDDGAPDPARFVEHADWLLRNGCTGLAPFGTTSEANSLGLDERMELLEELVDADVEPNLLMPGTGMCSLPGAFTSPQLPVDLDCGGCLFLPPFFYKEPSEEGLYRFFSEVIEGVGDDRLKIYLYHIPPIAQVGFSISLIRRLRAAYPETIVGLKDSSGNWANTLAVLDAVPDFEVFPGSEVFLLEGLRRGCAGVISASANINVTAISNVYDNWQSAEADRAQASLTGFRKAVQAHPLIPAVKALIAHYRGDQGWARLRPPLVELDSAAASSLVAMLEDEHGFAISLSRA